GGEAEADRFQDWVEPMLDADLAERVHGAREALQVVRRVRDRDHFRRGMKLMPASRVLDVRAVHAEYEFRAGRECSVHFIRVEAVDRDAKAIGFQRSYRVAHTAPRGPGVATEVDHVGAARTVAACFGEDRVERLLRPVIHFGEY